MATLPPFVASGEVQPCLTLIDDDVESQQERVARAAKRLELAKGLHHAGLTTEYEYGEHEQFHALL